MDMKQWCQLQAFELVYLVVLAFLPFVVAVREVTLTLMVILGLLTAAVVVRHLLMKRVDPDGKLVVISGCDSGFGNACARRLDAYGFTVIAGCLDTQSVGAADLRASSSTGRLHVVSLDVTDKESVDQFMVKVKGFSQSKGVWALINNAGIASFGDVEFTDIESYRKVLDINLIGAIQLTKLCLPLIRNARGRVINMSGSNGLMSLPGQSAFCIASYAIEAFSEALRLEMAAFGVKVITVNPGNYTGATGILNKKACEKLKNQFNDLQQSTDKEILDAYGSGYLESHFEQLSEMSKSSASSLVSVVSAMENAVVNLRSRSQYLVDGGGQLLDAGNILIRLRPFIPAALHEIMVGKLYRPRLS